jgi:hypothetical protein
MALPQTYRTNEQMMQAMKGATMALGSMNRTMNLPSLQRIAMEFERENDIMEQRQEMMDDAIDDAMDVGLEEEGDEVVEQVLEEIGVDLSQSVRSPRTNLFTQSVLCLCADVGGGLARRDSIRIAIRCSTRDKDCPGGWWRRRWSRPRRRRPSGTSRQPEEVSSLIATLNDMSMSKEPHILLRHCGWLI